MRAGRFLLLMAGIGYMGGSFVGWGLSEREIKMAMCSYYSEWEFCREVEEEERIRDLAISGLMKKVHELERRIGERGEHLCVKAYRLNIRLYPLDGKVIGIYRKGARVEVRDRIGGWVRTEEGWVSERWLERCGKNGDSSGSGGGNSLPADARGLPEPNPEGAEKSEFMHRVSSAGSSEVLR